MCATRVVVYTARPVLAGLQTSRCCDAAAVTLRQPQLHEARVWLVSIYYFLPQYHPSSTPSGAGVGESSTQRQHHPFLHESVVSMTTFSYSSY